MNWRSIAHAFSTFIFFRTDIVQSTWPQMAAILKSKLTQSPHALASTAIAFYQAIALVSSEGDVISALVDYSRSPLYQLRSFFIHLAIAVAFSFPFPVFIDHIWPAVLSLSEDRVSSVRATFLRKAPEFRHYFVSQGHAPSEKHLTTLFMVMGKDSDPLLQAVWLDASDRFTDTPGLLQRRVSLREQYLCRSANLLQAQVLRQPLRPPPVHVVDLPRKKQRSAQPSHLPLIDERKK
jgi:hypothetical protein